VSVVVIGCGAVARLYYEPALAALEREGTIKVAAAYDPDAGNCREFCRAFDAAEPLPNFAETLTRAAELTIIASPCRYHAEQAISALRHGSNVLCENPLAMTSEDAERMIASAQETGRLLSIGLYRRYLPAVRAVRNFISSGALGQLRAVSCFEGGPSKWPIYSADYFTRETSGGGVLQDVGIHCLDLLTWWLGSPNDIDYEDDAMGGVEANCRVRLGYGAFAADILLSRDWARPNRYVIEGTRGRATWIVNDTDRFDFGLHGESPSYAVSAGQGNNPHGMPNFSDYFSRQIRSIAQASRGLPTEIVSAQSGLDVLRLVEHCYRNRRLMAAPWLSPAEASRARTLAGKSA
jgi:myo-inositol 2-dehydrogenase / D-chiro-inositol 1-dehydrogenase